MVRICKKSRAKAKYLPNSLKHKEKSHRSITGPRDLGPRALWVYPGPFYCLFRGLRPSDGVKKWFEALTGKFLPFVVSYISHFIWREGGNVYEELTRIVLCDVTVIYVSYANKLYFLSVLVSSRRQRPRKYLFFGVYLQVNVPFQSPFQVYIVF